MPKKNGVKNAVCNGLYRQCSVLNKLTLYLKQKKVKKTW